MSRKQILILFLSFLVTLATGTTLVLRHSGTTKGLVEKVLGRFLQDFHLRTANLDLTTGMVTFEGFNIPKPGAPEATPLLAVERVEVDVSTAGSVRKIVLQRLNLNLGLSEDLNLDRILKMAGFEEAAAKEAGSMPAIVIQDSIIRLSIAPESSPMVFDKVEVQLLPRADDPDQMELTGSMISPLGHEVTLSGSGNLEKQEFRAMLLGADIDILPKQAEAFHLGAARYLEAAKVSGKVKKATAWLELRGADAENVDAERFRGGVNIEFEDLNVTPPEFPYEIKLASGQALITTQDQGTLKFELMKKGFDGDLDIVGRITHCFPGTPVFDLRLGGKGILVSGGLQTALDNQGLPAARRIWQAFQPEAGRVDADLRIWNRAIGSPLQAAADLDLHGVSATFFGFSRSDPNQRRVGFPYPLENVNGRVVIRPDVVVLEDIKAQAKGAEITVGGVVALEDDKAMPELDIRGSQLQFSEDLRTALDSLVEGGGEIYDRYRPEGRTDIRVQLGQKGDQLRYRVGLRPRLASSTYELFPYRLDEIQGRVEITDEGVELDLEGKRGETRVRVDGRFLFGSQQDGGLHSELWIKGEGFPLDGELRQALGPLTKHGAEYWEVLQPRGKLDCEVTMWKESEAAEFSYDVHLGLREGSVRVEKYPLPMEELHGDIFIHGSGDNRRVDISSLRGEIRNDSADPSAKLLVQGTIHDDASGLATDITSIVRRLRLTGHLAQAMHSSGVLDESAWNLLRPDGWVDVIGHLSKSKQKDELNHRIQIRLRDVSSEAAILPGKLTGLHGEVVIENGKAAFEEIKGLLDETPITCQNGSLAFGGDETVIRVTVRASGFPVNDKLANMMSGPVRKSFLAYKVRGRAKITELNLQFRFPNTSADFTTDFTTSFSGEFVANDLTLDTGSRLGFPLRNLTGVLKVKSGLVDKTGGRLHGSLGDVAFRLAGHQAHSLNGDFHLTDQSLILTKTQVGLHGGLARSAGPDGLALRYEFSGEGTLSAHLVWNGVNLNTLIRCCGLQVTPYQGVFGGEIHLERLTGSDFLGMQAYGELMVDNGRLGEAPLFTAIYSYLKPEHRPQFTACSLRFDIRDRQVGISNLQARSPLFKLEGQGKLRMDGYVEVTLDLPGVFGSAADLLILPPLLDMAVSKIVSFQVYGYVRNLRARPYWLWDRPRGRVYLGPIEPLPAASPPRRSQ